MKKNQKGGGHHQPHHQTIEDVSAPHGSQHQSGAYSHRDSLGAVQSQTISPRGFAPNQISGITPKNQINTQNFIQGVQSANKQPMQMMSPNGTSVRLTKSIMLMWSRRCRVPSAACAPRSNVSQSQNI